MIKATPGYSHRVNHIFNIIGLGTPIIGALVLTPLIVKAYGANTFGALSVLWAIMSYISVLDAGIARTFTYKTSVLQGQRAVASLSNLVVVGLTLGMTISSGIGVALILTSKQVSLLLVPNDVVIAHEMAKGLWWLGAMAPLISASNSLKGILDGAGQFGKSAFYKTVNSAAIFIVPYVLSFTNLNAISSVRFYWLVYFFQVLALSCEVFGNSSIFQLKLLEFAKHVKSNIKDFLGYGIWANVSSLLSPLMTNFDRLLLSALFGPAIVAPYAMAQEATQRFIVLPLALSTSYAPIFASNDKKHALSIYKSFKKRLDTFLAYLFLVLAFIVISYFKQWAGGEIHLDKAVLLLMCATGCINSYGQLPNIYLLSRGLSRITAVLTFCEAVVYLPMAYFLIAHFELMGAAVAAFVRVLIDCISLRRLASAKNHFLL